MRNYRYVQVIRRDGLSRADVQWRMFVQKISSHLGIRKPVNIWMSELVTSPVTIGYLKPVILLPLAAVNHLTTQQIEAVLLHELAHIKRYDYFVNLITKFIQTVLYFNPFVKAFAAIIEREREKSCDETVIQFQYEPHGYASALLVLEKAAHAPQRLLTVAATNGKKSEFRQRIEWILGIRQKQVFSFNKLAGILAGLLCFIMLNAFLIMSHPVKMLGDKTRTAFVPAPYELFTGGYDKTTNAAIRENHQAPITTEGFEAVAEAGKTGEQLILDAPSGESLEQVYAENGSLFNYVAQLQNFIPKLSELEEKQIQEALVESKKVIEEIRWKELEISIADAMTIVEKEKVKEQYEKAVNTIDWDKMGDKLRLAYDKIDWKQINAELDNALAEIKVDSLKQVYTVALDNLSAMQKELVKVNECSVPDTDITLQSIEVKKTEIQKAINHLKKIRPRKIVHL